MIELLNFIFTSFWTFLGTLILLGVLLSPFDFQIHYHIKKKGDNDNK